MTPAIRVRNISKRYRIGAAGPSYRTIREAIMESLGAAAGMLGGRRPAPAPEKHIWALNDVSFDLMPGEAVGLIGRNGAGKSTLLKILARVTRPTSGSAELYGSVGSLLDVGTGFHPELTGRENIFLNGAILGMKRRDIHRKLDRIVDFSGTAEFMDTPVKHYSSGMRVRLAFAVAAHLDTEILLADEVLAVGDAAFQKKCLEEISSIARGGRTVVFVSHNMGAVAQLCPRTILLDQGRVSAIGRTNEVIASYMACLSAGGPEVAIPPPEVDKGVVISQVGVVDSSGHPRGELDWRLPFDIEIEFRVTRRLPPLSLGVTLVNQMGIRLLFSWAVLQEAFEPGVYRVRGRFPREMLGPGRYHVNVAIEHYGVEYYHTAQEAVSFEIINTTGEFDGYLGEYGLLYARIPWQRNDGRPVT